ncbi:MAG: ImmA/IrrE family metallo-endopeptidase [Bacteroidales bacterium]|jgi:Zn-dependent peptidase ImmA (M78 family)
MNSKSSTEKGNELEKQVYDLLKRMLDNDSLFVNGKKSKIFWKKEYFSDKRKGNIIFDVTIETFLNGADKYSVLTIIECKNLKRRVSVDDIEEFNSKISQIAEHNAKGIVITTNYFQESALNYARSQGIGLAKIVNNDELKWVNYRKDKSNNLLSNKDLEKQFLSQENSSEKFIASINNKIVLDFADLLIESKIIDFYPRNERNINVPYIKEEKIDEKVAKLSEHNIYYGQKLDTEKLCKFLSEVYPITFDFSNNLEDNLLGKIEFNPLKIYISKSITDENRWRFTLAHEIGHLILHYSILKEKLKEKIDDEDSINLQNLITDKTQERIELQANLFASHILLPKKSFYRSVFKYFSDNNIYNHYLYLDNQKCNICLVYNLLNEISLKYGVSNEVAKIRLINLNLLRGNLDFSLKNKIGQILKN